MAIQVQAKSVVVPASGAVQLMEQVELELSSYGGSYWMKNSGTVNLLLGGNDQNCVFPLNPGEFPVGPWDLDNFDQIYAKIASGSVAGALALFIHVK